MPEPKGEGGDSFPSFKKDPAPPKASKDNTFDEKMEAEEAEEPDEPFPELSHEGVVGKFLSFSFPSRIE